MTNPITHEEAGAGNRPGSYSMSLRFHSSRSCHWVQPRQAMHASERFMRHGPVQPMQEPSFWERMRRRG